MGNNKTRRPTDRNSKVKSELSAATRRPDNLVEKGVNLWYYLDTQIFGNTVNKWGINVLKKNDIIPLEISEITGQGSGIGRADGMAVFIPHTAVGDKIEARILKVKKSYAFAKTETLLEPSPIRTEPDCKWSAKCGGCVFRHISYEEELKIKQRRVFDALTRIGGLEDFIPHNIIGCDDPDGYRNKTQLPVGRDKNGDLLMGFYGSHSHRIVGNGDCRLQPDEFNILAKVVREWIEEFNISVYNEELHKGLLRHLYMRKGFSSGEIMVCLVANGDTLPHEKELINRLTSCNKNVKSIVLNINREKTNVILGKECRTIYGSGHITDKLCGLRFNISPLSFYQINHDQTEKLYGLAARYAGLSGKELLIDLYCGAGTIGLSMAKKAKKLIGVEIIPQAIENAKENAMLNDIDNAEFVCADASQAAKQLAERGTSPDVVVIDPPRKGCDNSVIEAIAVMSPKKIVYVSCDPETLARDLKIFDSLGYSVKDVTPVDMFPRTAHVETVVWLSGEE